MKRKEILNAARQYIGEDRNISYGEPEDSFKAIAAYWTTYMAHRKPHLSQTTGKPVFDEYDVARMLGLMKDARADRRPIDMDSLIDIAGYAACAGEILAWKQGPTPPHIATPSPDPIPAAPVSLPQR